MKAFELLEARYKHEAAPELFQRLFAIAEYASHYGKLALLASSRNEKEPARRVLLCGLSRFRRVHERLELGKIALKIGEKALAAAALENLYPRTPWEKLEYAAHALNSGQTEPAARFFRELPAQPFNVDSCKLAIASGQREEMERIYQLSRNPEEPWQWCSYAEICCLSGRREEALTAWGQAIRTDSESFFDVAESAFRCGEYALAEEYIKHNQKRLRKNLSSIYHAEKKFYQFLLRIDVVCRLLLQGVRKGRSDWFKLMECVSDFAPAIVRKRLKHIWFYSFGILKRTFTADSTRSFARIYAADIYFSRLYDCSAALAELRKAESLATADYELVSIAERYFYYFDDKDSMRRIMKKAEAVLTNYGRDCYNRALLAMQPEIATEFFEKLLSDCNDFYEIADAVDIPDKMELREEIFQKAWGLAMEFTHFKRLAEVSVDSLENRQMGYEFALRAYNRTRLFSDGLWCVNFMHTNGFVKEAHCRLLEIKPKTNREDMIDYELELSEISEKLKQL